MSTPPYANQRPRTLRDLNDLVHAIGRSIRLRADEEFRQFRIVRRRALTHAADTPWRFGVGIIAVLAPALMLAAIGSSLPVTTPGIVLLVAVACSAYLADWVGGLTSLVLTAVLLNLFFIGGPLDLSIPNERVEAAGFTITLVCGAALIVLIQRIKLESQVDRRAAVAARAAANALASIEAAAAVHASGSGSSRHALHRSLLRAMVSFNRAHIGVLFLVDNETEQLRVATTYGLDRVADLLHSPADVADGFVNQIAQERRTRVMADLATDKRAVGSLLRRTNARAIIGVPLIDTDDRLIGVAVVGLLVAHRFTSTEIARIEALATRAGAVLQAAVGIDERETALHSATASKRWLELVIAAMPEAVVLAMPPDGRIIAENQASVERFGHLTGPDSIGDIMQRLTLPDGDPLDDQSSPIKEAFRTGEVVSGVELVAHGPHGTRMPVLVSAAPVREDDGPVVAVVAVFRDIAALKEASRLKDEFVSVVSHELRSPLTPIRGFVQLVAKDLAREGGHDPLVSRLSSIAGHVDRMTRLVDDLLDVSRLKSGSLEIRPGTTDLGELCADVIRDRSASVATHRFEFTEPDELVIGDWDADRLYQVIDNLVGNAIKYSPPGGTVTVSAGVDLNDGSAFVTVADDGPGIAASDRDRIFSAFYRTSDAAASQIAGLGLGLYICHELVAAHGGSIEVGGAEGGGAAFTVRLPRITQAVAA